MTTALPNDTACREYLELRRWHGIPVCPICGAIDEKHYKLTTKGEFKGMYKCRSCKERFTVTIGTIFEGSNIGLHKWFMALYIFSAHKKGISSHQLARDLGVTQKTAWFMLHRLRTTFTENNDEPLGGEGVVVECDNTVVGGKVKNVSASYYSFLMGLPPFFRENTTFTIIVSLILVCLLFFSIYALLIWLFDNFSSRRINFSSIWRILAIFFFGIIIYHISMVILDL